MKIHALLGTFALSSCWVSAAIADVIDVPTDHATIQAAIDASVDGDEIVLAPGTYIEHLNMLGKALTLRGTNPNDQAVVDATIIDGDATGRVITIPATASGDVVLSGLTIQNGDENQGGGVSFIDAHVSINNCLFQNNEGGIQGGGIYAIGARGPSARGISTLTVTGSRFQANTADAGAGVFLDGTVDFTFDDCDFQQRSEERV